MELSRRSFLGKTAVAGTGAVVIPTVISANVFGAIVHSNVAVLGVNGKGRNHISSFMGLDNVNVSILCNLDLNIAGIRAKEFEKEFGQKVGVVQDLRDVLDNKDIDAVRLHDVPLLNGPVETSHFSSALAHLGNIAYRTGKVFNFDPETERFIDHPEADNILTRNYRAPYIVPTKV